MAAAATQDVAVSEDAIPARILWLNQHLPWKQFMFAEAFVVASITVLVLIGALLAQATFGFYEPPCNTKPCDNAMNLARGFARPLQLPCDGFYDHLCGHGVADKALGFQFERAASAALLRTAARSPRPATAVDKLAHFFAACHELFVPSETASNLQRDVQAVLIALKLRVENIRQLATTNYSTLRFLLRLTMVHNLDLGLRLRIHGSKVQLSSRGGLRSYLDVPRIELEALLSAALNATSVRVSSELIELLIFDDSLVGFAYRSEEAVPLPFNHLLRAIYPRSISDWRLALIEVPEAMVLLHPTTVVHVLHLSFLHTFTQFIFVMSTRTTRFLWLLFHALLPALEAAVTRRNPADRLSQAATSFCYAQCQSSLYGVVMNAFLLTSSQGSASAAPAVAAMMDLLRSQAVLSAKRLFRGGLLHQTLEAIEDVELTLLLGTKSADDAKYLEEVYKNIDTCAHGGYFETRLLSPSALSDDTALVQRQVGCLDNDLGGVSFPTPRRVCVFPRGVSPPLFYADAEPFVNLPTLGFLLAAPYANVLHNALRKAPEGSEASRRYAATSACLGHQVDALTKTSLINEPRPGDPAALFRHAAALQLAYDAVENSAGFPGGDLERRAFFERHCWLWCSGYMKAPPSSVAAAGAKAVCNIAVRNVLAFYLAFRCYPEDFMGRVEVCAVFGVPEQFKE